jgi:hypothetical protein
MSLTASGLPVCGVMIYGVTTDDTHNTWNTVMTLLDVSCGRKTDFPLSELHSLIREIFNAQIVLLTLHPDTVNIASVQKTHGDFLAHIQTNIEGLDTLIKQEASALTERDESEDESEDDEATDYYKVEAIKRNREKCNLPPLEDSDGDPLEERPRNRRRGEIRGLLNS